MARTAELRKLAKSKIDTLPGETYYMRAPVDAVFPYKIINLRSINTGERQRYDYSMEIDVWDLAGDPKRVEEIADGIEDMLDGENYPTEMILATVFLDSRLVVDDPDKDIQHIKLTFLVQLYSR